MVTLVWGGGEGVLGGGVPPPLVFNHSKEALPGAGAGAGGMGRVFPKGEGGLVWFGLGWSALGPWPHRLKVSEGLRHGAQRSSIPGATAPLAITGT